MSTEPMHLINRREAVRRIALIMGTAMVASDVILRGASVGVKDLPAFTDADKALLDEIGETIIPTTDIPGAKATGIGPFMAMFVTDCYNQKEHATFSDGLGKIDAESKRRFGKGFVDATPEQRLVLCNDLDKEQRRFHDSKPKGEQEHYFRMMKELTLMGYFSSEIGCTQAVSYIEVPGAWHGDVPFKKGDKEWY
ncbi:MAG TPA: gluconate 2-dehydrogenase subunit 3 family protein [Opitutaceae bacterium]|jgi:hypothetical protein